MMSVTNAGCWMLTSRTALTEIDTMPVTMPQIFPEGASDAAFRHYGIR